MQKGINRENNSNNQQLEKKLLGILFKLIREMRRIFGTMRYVKWLPIQLGLAMKAKIFLRMMRNSVKEVQFKKLTNNNPQKQ